MYKHTYIHAYAHKLSSKEYTSVLDFHVAGKRHSAAGYTRARTHSHADNLACFG